MAKVLVKFTGSPVQSVEANTVGEALNLINDGGDSSGYSAKIDGNSAQLSDSVSEVSFVVFSKAVKGGA